MRKKTYLILTCLTALTLCLSLLSGCGEKEKKNDKPVGIMKEFKGSAGKLILKTDRKELTVAQPLALELTAVCAEEWKVQMPELKDKLGDFTIRTTKALPTKLSDDGKEKSVTLKAVLDPYLAGEYKLLPLTVKFTNASGSSYDVSTEEAAILVTAVIPPDDKKPALRDISSVVEIPFKLETWMIILAAAILVIIIAVVIILVKRRKEIIEEEHILLPHEIALNELENLLHSNLLKTGHIKEFYLTMSDILRHYIEARFSLAAPERTTEEFLEELKLDPALNSEQKSLLKNFLRHCDLVKFARHQPANDDIKNSVNSCRDFIEETKPQPEPELNTTQAD